MYLSGQTVRMRRLPDLELHCPHMACIDDGSLGVTKFLYRKNDSSRLIIDTKKEHKWTRREKINLIAYADSVAPDQPAHALSLIQS